jgi:hypothetical protein
VLALSIGTFVLVGPTVAEDFFSVLQPSNHPICGFDHWGEYQVSTCLLSAADATRLGGACLDASNMVTLWKTALWKSCAHLLHSDVEPKPPADAHEALLRDFLVAATRVTNAVPTDYPAPDSPFLPACWSAQISDRWGRWAELDTAVPGWRDCVQQFENNVVENYSKHPEVRRMDLLDKFLRGADLKNAATAAKMRKAIVYLEQAPGSITLADLLGQLGVLH